MGLEIRTTPDPILFIRQDPVTAEQLASDKVQKLIGDMVDFVIDYSGIVGLAANQVGYNLRIIVAYSGEFDFTAFINPEIIERSSLLRADFEGCLSLPGQRLLIPRPEAIVLRALDRDGRLVEGRYRDFPARVIQHETDHINGILISQRVVNPRLQFAEDLTLSLPS